MIKDDGKSVKSRHKVNVMQQMLSEINHQMFPAGEEEELRQVRELFRLLDGRYSLGMINETLRFILSQMLLNRQKTKAEVLASMARRKGNLFTAEDAEVVYDYAIACNKRLSQIYGTETK